MMRLVNALICPIVLSAAIGCGGPSVQIDSMALRIVHAAPHHGAVEVSPEVLPLLGFSAGLSRTELESVVLEAKTGSVYQAIDVRRVPRDDGRVVILVPRSLLAPGTEYRIRLDAGAMSETGDLLEADFESHFITTRETE